MVEIVSIDRLKSAHVDDSAPSDILRFNVRPIKPSGILKPSSGPTLDTPETSFSRPGQQHASSALSTDETTVSRPDQQTTPPLTSDEIAGSRDANETTVSRSGRRVRLPVRFPHAFDHLRLVPSTSVNFGESWPDHPRSCHRTQSIYWFECLAHAWSRTWSLRSLLAQRGFVLRLQRFWSAFPTNAIFRFWIQTTRVACQLKQQVQHIAPGTVLRKRPSLATR
ncbi:unnamed protein product [Schistosoma margrebowiei]|uniref:Uncharacterized protein n=1 Tax=Schistosoma margrebowiei TaxID=48269 RepID=A0A183LXS2_9TREM|nr:unnamed protein product [Schistosoma margrebowiei]